jgi:hypothetical protein
MSMVWRLGLDGAAPETLTVLGQRLGVTREWVRQIEVGRCIACFVLATFDRYVSTRKAQGHPELPDTATGEKMESKSVDVNGIRMRWEE